jgi:hypothetical protein
MTNIKIYSSTFTTLNKTDHGQATIGFLIVFGLAFIWHIGLILNTIFTTTQASVNQIKLEKEETRSAFTLFDNL